MRSSQKLVNVELLKERKTKKIREYINSGYNQIITMIIMIMVIMIIKSLIIMITIIIIVIIITIV